MSKERAYYFINHTRKEFIYLPKNISVTIALEEALHNYVGWSSKHNIRIDSEAYDSVECLERMDSMLYTIAKPVSEDKKIYVRSLLDNLDVKLNTYRKY